MGGGWDTANARSIPCVDEAAFVTGAVLPVDGDMSIRLGQLALAAWTNC